MADNDFVVKNGLIVNTNLIVANGDSNSVGINNSSPDATFVVTGTANVSGDVALGGTLSAGNTSLANTNITGYINASSTANVGGAATLRGSLTVNGATIVANTISTGNNTTTGWINVSSTANVGGATNLRGTLAVNGAVTIANTLSVGNTSVTGFVTATTNSTFSGDITTVKGIRFSTDSSYTVGNTTHRPSKIWSDDIETENITITGFITGTIAPAGSIIPTTNLSADLGSSAKWFDELYVGSITTNTFTVSDGGSGVSITSNTQSFKSNSSITAISIRANTTTSNTTLSGNLVTITSNTNVSVANLTVTNGTFISTNGSVTTTVNNSTIQIGGGATVNSTVFSGISNNSTYLNGQLASYYTNATNLSTGTIPSARLPEATTSVRGGVILLNSTSSTNTTAAAVPASVKSAYDYAGTIAGTAYTNATSYAATIAGTAYTNATSYADTIAGTAYSNATTFSANASNLGNGTVPSGRISGSYTGITGVGTIATGIWQGSQISTTYTQAKVTSVSGGNGLTGTVTTSGSISVLANTGIVANGTGLYVNSAYIGTLSSNNATYFNGQAASYYTGYSDTKAATAYTNATSYAATIAGTAYTNATSYAATIAGTAYSNATSYAATIAGTAYSNATSYTTTYAPSKTGSGASGNWSINASTATTLQTARTINNVSFNGSANIVVEPYISGSDSGDTNCPIVFTLDSTAGYKRLYEDSALYFDNTNNILYSGSFSGSGASLTALNASNLSSGTVPSARLSGTYTITATSATNADTVDSLHAASFIRSDANDNVTGHTEWQDNYEVRLGTGADLRIYHDGTNSVLNNYTGGFLFYEVAGGSYIWHVDGSNKLQLDSSGNLTAASNITAYSDVRLKKEIKTIDNALNKVTSLRGVNFIKDEEYQMGVIAQEVEEIIPEVVLTNDEGIKSVAYGNMVGILIEAIKELKEEIEQLKGNK